MILDTMSLAFLMNMTTMELFTHGGPIMWPILLASFVMITVMIERILLIIRENGTREPEVVEKMLEKTEQGDTDGAIQIGNKSKDLIARILVYALSHKEHSVSTAYIRASNQELTRFGQGIGILDTIVTAAPYLGLLGTVTGMMKTFAALGDGDISQSTGAITGGVGEALIATMCGLAIAIVGLFPFNYLNGRTEDAKQQISDASDALTLIRNKAAAEKTTA